MSTLLLVMVLVAVPMTVGAIVEAPELTSTSQLAPKVSVAPATRLIEKLLTAVVSLRTAPAGRVPILRVPAPAVAPVRTMTVRSTRILQGLERATCTEEAAVAAETAVLAVAEPEKPACS